MKVDLKQVENACKELYIRALKLLPPDSTRRARAKRAAALASLGVRQTH